MFDAAPVLLPVHAVTHTTVFGQMALNQLF